MLPYILYYQLFPKVITSNSNNMVWYFMPIQHSNNYVLLFLDLLIRNDRFYKSSYYLKIILNDQDSNGSCNIKIQFLWGSKWIIMGLLWVIKALHSFTGWSIPEIVKLLFYKDVILRVNLSNFIYLIHSHYYTNVILQLTFDS